MNVEELQLYLTTHWLTSSRQTHGNGPGDYYALFACVCPSPLYMVFRLSIVKSRLQRSPMHTASATGDNLHSLPIHLAWINSLAG
jgi:hypothetical protein